MSDRSMLAVPPRLQAWWDAIPGARIERVASAIVTLGTGSVLAIAAWLKPSPAGFGTHLQLGLSPCTFLTLTGFPCPMCGATTTFALWAHGHPLAGLANQPFASFLFLATAIAFSVSAAEVLVPRRRWTRMLDAIEPYEGWLAGGFLAFMLAGWLYKVAMMRDLVG